MGEIQQLKGRERTHEGDKQEGGGEEGEVKYVMCCGGGERWGERRKRGTKRQMRVVREEGVCVRRGVGLYPL